MRSRQSAAIVLTLLVLTFTARAQDKRASKNYPPEMKGCRTEVYKQIGDTKLKIYIFEPKTHSANESRSSIVFFFGGGWRAGTPKQFEQHCRYFASRGMIAMAADYRVASRHNTKAVACVRDAKSAIRWVRTHARRLGVDPDRVIAGGGSAGGHIAACTGTIHGLDEQGEDLAISSVPNGLALFNPALVLAPVLGESATAPKKLEQLADRLGTELEQLSPFHQLKKPLPPTIIFHGRDDKTVPYRTAEAFTERAKQQQADIELRGYEGEDHGFFNFGRAENRHYIDTVQHLDRFMVDRGLLEGPTPKTVKILE